MGSCLPRSAWRRFKQQELYAWRPITTPCWVIWISLLIGLTFTVAGLVSLSSTDDRFELIQEYDDGSGEDRLVDGVVNQCSIEEIDEGYQNILDGIPRTCTVSFTFPRDVPTTEDLFLHYEVERVYQGHLSYVVSRNADQLLNDVIFDEDVSAVITALEDDCEQDEILFNSDGNRRLVKFPCGLIAQSYFNDGIQFRRFFREGEFNLLFNNSIAINDDVELVDGNTINLNIDRTGIAFQSDLDDEFRNPIVGTNFPNYDVFEYIWQRYDQFSCYDPADLTVRADCVSWQDFVRNVEQPDIDQTIDIPGNGCSPQCVDPGHILVDEGGIRPPDDNSSELSSFGIRDENFINWMRTATFDTFRNLYGRVTLDFTSQVSGKRILQDSDSLQFKEGDVLEFNIIPNFLVSEFGGKKRLILSNTSPRQGNTRKTAQGYLAVGLCALTAGALVLAKQVINPRTLGDPKYLDSKKQ